jgi:hypothetical protein
VGVGLLPVENPQCIPAAFGLQTAATIAPGGFSSLAAFGVTDAEGKYRFENVPPGRYYLMAGAFFMGGGRGQCFQRGQYQGFIAEPTYHPGTKDFSAATPLAVAAGDSTLPDLRFAAGTGFRISGRVVGTPVVNEGGQLQVNLLISGGQRGGGFRASVGPDGSFEFRDIAPGSYQLDVRANYGDTGRGAFRDGSGTMNITVVDKNITGLVLGNAAVAGALAGNPAARGTLAGTAVVGPALPAVAPSGRPALLEVRLGMIPHEALTTVKDCGHSANASTQPVVGACVEEAVRAKTPFVASFEQPGSSPQIVLGLGGTAPDSVVQVQFDGAPSSGPGNARVTAPRDCREPKVEFAAGLVQVACK